MKPDQSPTPTNHCGCCNEHGQCTGHAERQAGINRRRFLVAGSGSLLATLGAAADATAAEWPPVDIGPIKDFPEDGISEAFIKNDFFVIRFQRKLFAASSNCPHMGNYLRRDPQDSTRILCGTHGSAFDAEGNVVVGPASSGLIRLGITLNADGHVVINRNRLFPQEKWTDKGCYLEVK